MVRKTISIITPSYNTEEFIESTIKSVLNQTYPNIEHIIVDDGSRDRSWSIIQRFRDKLKAIQTDHRGGSYARNYGTRLAQGEYIMFLDADDIISPDTICSLLATLESRSNSIAVCKWGRLVKRKGKWIEEPSQVPIYPPGGDPIKGWLTGWFYPTCATLWPRDVYENTGGWDENLSANQDGDLMLRALLNGIRVELADGGKGFYRSHGISRLSVSSDLKSKRAFQSRMLVLEKVAEKLEKLNLVTKYSEALGIAYHKLARNNFDTNPELARECQKRAEFYSGGKIHTGSLMHRLLSGLLGLERKEKVASSLAKIGIMNRQRRKSIQMQKLLNQRDGK